MAPPVSDAAFLKNEILPNRSTLLAEASIPPLFVAQFLLILTTPSNVIVLKNVVIPPPSSMFV